jgi:rubrerythrin
VENAIRTAIEFETRIRDLYADATKQATDKVARRVFGVLAAEEQHHLDYLGQRLGEWQKTGKITAARLETTIPPKAALATKVRQLKGQVSHGTSGTELDMLKRALKVELETSDFYRKLRSEMTDDAKKLFARFLEIEEGHQAIVQAEIDALTHTGFWFDFPEFNLEANV